MNIWLKGALLLCALSPVASVVQAQSLAWPPQAERIAGRHRENMPGPYFAPEFSPPKFDPLSLNDSFIGKGIFVYAPLVLIDPAEPYNRARYFVFRGKGIKGTLGSKTIEAISYSANDGEGNCFDPELAPGMKFLSYKNGDWKGAHDSYRLFYWDFEKRRVGLASSYIFFPQVRWSRDAKYLAYIGGGDGVGSEDDSPTTLLVHDISSGTTTSVANHPFLYASEYDYRSLQKFSWADEHTLLYAAPKAVKSSPTATFPEGQKPSVFETDLRTGEATLLIAEGYAPLCSPNDEKIAFLGWPQNSRRLKAEAPAKKVGGDYSLALCVFDRKTSRTTVVKGLALGSRGVERPNDLAFHWTPDSRSLVIASAYHQYARTTPKKTDKQSSHGGEMTSTAVLQIDQVRVEKLGGEVDEVKHITQIQLPNFLSGQNLRVNTAGLSRNGNLLYLKIPFSHEDDVCYESFVGVNLTAGKVINIAEFRPQDNYTHGFSWYEIK